MQLQVALNKTSCPTPTPLIYRQLRYPDFSRKVHNIRTEKLIMILPSGESNLDRQCGSPDLGSQKFMSPLILNTNFVKEELKIGYT